MNSNNLQTDLRQCQVTFLGLIILVYIFFTFSDITSALLVASSSDGKLSTWQVSDSGLEKLAYWKAHDFEAWISAFDYWNPNLVYSGENNTSIHLYLFEFPSSTKLEEKSDMIYFFLYFLHFFMHQSRYLA